MPISSETLIGGMKALEPDPGPTPSEEMESRIIGLVQAVVALERLADDDEAFMHVISNADHIGEIADRALGLAMKTRAALDAINGQRALQGSH